MLALQPLFCKQPSVFDYFDNLDRLFDAPAKTAFAPVKSDIIEKDDAYILSAELPGYSKEEIKIDISDNILTIQATHSSEEEHKDTDADKEASKEEPLHYICKERSTMSFKRSFNVEGVDCSAINAKLENGILELTLPKMTPKEPEKITINVA